MSHHLETPGPIPLWICNCSFVKTTDTQSYITPLINDPIPDLTSYRIWLLSLISLIWLLTEFNITEYTFPLGICNGCGMQTGYAYSSGHLVLSHFGIFKCFYFETKHCFRTFEFRTSLGTSVLLKVSGSKWVSLRELVSKVRGSSELVEWVKLVKWVSKVNNKFKKWVSGVIEPREWVS